MKELLLTYWRGEQPLWKTFWLLYVLGGAIYALITLEFVLIIASLAAKFGFVLYDTTGSFPDVDKGKAVYWMLWAILMLPYYIFGMVSVWRCPASQARWPKLSYAACLIAVLNFVKTLLRIIFLTLIIAGASLPHYLINLTLQRHSYQLPNNSYANEDQVFEFAQKATMAVFNYDYKNYAQQFDKAQDYFSSESWKVFNEALAASHNIQEVKNKQLAVSAKVTGYPKLLKEDTFLDQISWLVEIPITVTYQEPAENLQSIQAFNVKLLVTQSDDSDGLQVSQFVTELRQ